jgi:hypothetical protein
MVKWSAVASKIDFLLERDRGCRTFLDRGGCPRSTASQHRKLASHVGARRILRAMMELFTFKTASSALTGGVTDSAQTISNIHSGDKTDDVVYTIRKKYYMNRPFQKLNLVDTI